MRTNIDNKEFKSFFNFLLKRTYQSESTTYDESILNHSFVQTVCDVKYHYPTVSDSSVWESVTSNRNELIIWLYRTGRNFWNLNHEDPISGRIHWLMKDLCSCEIYFSTAIDTGLYVFHGEGLVIGSRNMIGKGLRVYQNVTIGHKVVNSAGATIGNNVKIYSGAKVLGNITVGNNVIIGANTVITKNIASDRLVYGNPNIIHAYKNPNLI